MKLTCYSVVYFTYLTLFTQYKMESEGNCGWSKVVIELEELPSVNEHEPLSLRYVWSTKVYKTRNVLLAFWLLSFLLVSLSPNVIYAILYKLFNIIAKRENNCVTLKWNSWIFGPISRKTIYFLYFYFKASKCTKFNSYHKFGTCLLCAMCRPYAVWISSSYFHMT